MKKCIAILVCSAMLFTLTPAFVSAAVWRDEPTYAKAFDDPAKNLYGSGNGNFVWDGWTYYRTFSWSGARFGGGLILDSGGYGTDSNNKATATSDFTFTNDFKMQVEQKISSVGNVQKISFNGYTLQMTGNVVYALTGGGISATLPAQSGIVGNNFLYTMTVEAGVVKIVRSGTDGSNSVTLFEVTAPSPVAYGGKIGFYSSDGSATYKNLKVFYAADTFVPVGTINVTGAGGATAITADRGTLQMSAEVLPVNAALKDVTWSVTNETGKATIGVNGLLTAVDNGTVLVQATAKDGSGTVGSLRVTISGQVKVQTINVTGEGGTAAITTDFGTLVLNAEVLPETVVNRSVTWSVQNGTGSAIVVSTGDRTGLLRAISNGNLTVSATANDGSGKIGSLAVTISGQLDYKTVPAYTEQFVDRASVFDSGNWIEGSNMPWVEVNNGLVRNPNSHVVSSASSSYTFPEAFRLVVDLQTGWSYSDAGYSAIKFNGYTLRAQQSSGVVNYTLTGGGLNLSLLSQSQGRFLYNITVGDVYDGVSPVPSGGLLKVVRTNLDGTAPLTLFDTIAAPSPLPYGGNIVLDGAYSTGTFRSVKVYYKDGAPIEVIVAENSAKYTVSGNTVNISADLVQTLAGIKSVHVIAVAYGDNNRMLGKASSSFASTDFSGGNTKAYSQSLVVANGADVRFVRLYIWRALTTRTPLIGAVQCANAN